MTHRRQFQRLTLTIPFGLNNLNLHKFNPLLLFTRHLFGYPRGFPLLKIPMLHNLQHLRPIIRIHPQNHMQQRNLLLSKLLREVQVLLHARVDLLAGVAAERRTPLNHFEEEDAERPDVVFLGVRLAEDHLR